MRGKELLAADDLQTLRITPACAGKSRSQPRLPCTGRDHPRVCGEKVPITCVPKYALGSPPHVRGKGNGIQERHDDPGITPACAGKRTLAQLDAMKSRDHPRACGEKRAGLAGERSGLGSPPRMRGKGIHTGVVLGNRGITPAHAGKSCRRNHSGRSPQDHPRVCGEKHPISRIAAIDTGSPPRMRGKDHADNICFNAFGITPAYAGKRRSSRWL